MLKKLGNLFNRSKPDIPDDQKDKFKDALFNLLNDPNKGDPDSLKKLLDTSNYSVSAQVLDSLQDEEGNNALQLAVKHNKINILKVLLKRGCTARRADRNRVTPLQLAITTQNEAIVNILLQDGGGVNLLNTSDIEGLSPLHYAIKQFPRHPNIFNAVAAYCGIDQLNWKTSKGDCALHMAAKIGAVEVLDWIVETMGDQLHLEHAGLDGWTALHAACKAGHVAFVEALIKHGAKRNVTNYIGETPLHVCTYFGHADCVKALLKTKAPEKQQWQLRDNMDIDFESNVHMGHIPSYEPEDFCVVQCRDVFGNTPLMYALGYRQPKAFSKSRTTIIAKLKDIDKSQVPKKKRKKTEEKTGPLPLEVIEMLLKYEAKRCKSRWAHSIHWPNNEGISPYDYVKSLTGKKAKSLLELLEKYACDTDSLSTIIPRSSTEHCLQLQVASDLHIEFLLRFSKEEQEERLTNLIQPKAPYLALLGDIGVPASGKNTQSYNIYREFLRDLSKKFKKVMVIAGNHEYYHGNIEETDKLIQEICDEDDVKDTLVFLNRNHKGLVLDGVRIIGCTLWSDVPSQLESTVQFYLNDYRSITIDEVGNSLRVSHTREFFKQDLQYITKQIKIAKKNNQPLVVLTHNSPLLFYGSSNPEYWTSSIRNAFATDLRDKLGAPIAAWIYGHTHWFHDMVINNTRIVANQGGYPAKNYDNKPYYNNSFVVRIHKAPANDLTSN